MGNENPDIVILKVDFDENRDIAKALAIKVRSLIAHSQHLPACVCSGVFIKGVTS